MKATNTNQNMSGQPANVVKHRYCMKHGLGELHGLATGGIVVTSNTLVKTAQNLMGNIKTMAIINDDYALVDSPFKKVLESCFISIVDTSGLLSDPDKIASVESAMYFSVTKRMKKREYLGDPSEYLSGLLLDVQSAKHEFSEVCYDSSYASDVFVSINNTVLSLLSSRT